MGITLVSENQTFANQRWIYGRGPTPPDGDRSISISAECDWEVEHGLQMVFRGGGRLSRVSDQDGHLTHSDVYDTPENEDKIA